MGRNRTEREQEEEKGTGWKVRPVLPPAVLGNADRGLGNLS